MIVKMGGRIRLGIRKHGVSMKSPVLSGYDWHGRLMFGTDLPVWQAHENCGLTKQYREYALKFRMTGLEANSDAAFRGFAAGVKG